MLNLLIAIISDTYTRLQEQKEQLKYQTKASIISDYLHLIGKVETTNRDRYLIVAMEAERRDNDQGERWSLDDVMSEVRKLDRSVGTRMDKLEEMIDVKLQVKLLHPEEELN